MQLRTCKVSCISTSSASISAMFNGAPGPIVFGFGLATLGGIVYLGSAPATYPVPCVGDELVGVGGLPEPTLAYLESSSAPELQALTARWIFALRSVVGEDEAGDVCPEASWPVRRLCTMSESASGEGLPAIISSLLRILLLLVYGPDIFLPTKLRWLDNPSSDTDLCVCVGEVDGDEASTLAAVAGAAAVTVAPAIAAAAGVVPLLMIAEPIPGGRGGGMRRLPCSGEERGEPGGDEIGDGFARMLVGRGGTGTGVSLAGSGFCGWESSARSTVPVATPTSASLFGCDGLSLAGVGAALGCEVALSLVVVAIFSLSGDTTSTLVEAASPGLGVWFPSEGSAASVAVSAAPPAIVGSCCVIDS
jgi:hypothetical protein